MFCQLPVSGISLCLDKRFHNPSYEKSPFIDFPGLLGSSTNQFESLQSLTATCLKLEGLMLFYKVSTHNIPNIQPFISTLKILERWSGSASSPGPPTPASVFLPNLFFHSIGGGGHTFHSTPAQNNAVSPSRVG